MENRPLTVAQAAKRVGRSTARIYQLIKTGALPGTKFGNSWMIKPADLDALPPLPGSGRPRGRLNKRK